jgi:uncharacterized protein
VACRQKGDKRRLVRLVRTADQGVVVDPSGRLPGRGAYLCDRWACWQKAATTDLLDRALRTSVTAEEKERLLAHRPALENETAD